jgi:DNA-directed RNA polymerase subunit alpha
MQTNLLKPKNIHVEQISANRAKVTLEPFERGYGHTLAMPCADPAVVDGRLCADRSVDRGVLHEYSTMDGVQEDVVDILLNLKGVVFKLHNRDEAT